MVENDMKNDFARELHCKDVQKRSVESAATRDHRFWCDWTVSRFLKNS